MACYIEITKIKETDKYVQYQFSNSKDNSGVMNIDKQSGDITIVEEAPNDINGLLSERAARALIRHWRKGDYPDKTCWAS